VPFTNNDESLLVNGTVNYNSGLPCRLHYDAVSNCVLLTET